MTGARDNRDEMHPQPALDDAPVEAVLRDGPVPADVEPLASALGTLRDLPEQPVRPSAELAARMATGGCQRCGTATQQPQRWSLRRPRRTAIRPARVRSRRAGRPPDRPTGHRRNHRARLPSPTVPTRPASRSPSILGTSCLSNLDRRTNSRSPGARTPEPHPGDAAPAPLIAGAAFYMQDSRRARRSGSSTPWSGFPEAIG